MNESGLRDKRIIDLFFARDEYGITLMREDYGKLIFYVCNNILADYEDSLECENDTYLKSWNLIPPTIPDCLKAFCAKIARNISMNRFRYNSASKRNEYVTISIDELEECIPDASQEFSENELREIINGFLESLKPDHRIVFMQKYWYMMSVKDISDKTGFTHKKVEDILYRTRRKFKLYLNDK